MDASTIIDTLTPLVAGATYEAARSVDFPTIYVPASHLVATCQALRDTPALRPYAGFGELADRLQASRLVSLREDLREILERILLLLHDADGLELSDAQTRLLDEPVQLVELVPLLEPQLHPAHAEADLREASGLGDGEALRERDVADAVEREGEVGDLGEAVTCHRCPAPVPLR
mgnify:CR=1 FL=1